MKDRIHTTGRQSQMSPLSLYMLQMSIILLIKSIFFGLQIEMRDRSRNVQFLVLASREQGAEPTAGVRRFLSASAVPVSFCLGVCSCAVFCACVRCHGDTRKQQRCSGARALSLSLCLHNKGHQQHLYTAPRPLSY